MGINIKKITANPLSPELPPEIITVKIGNKERIDRGISHRISEAFGFI